MVSVALFVYAAVLTLLGRVLIGRQWTSRAPRLAILTWQCLTASVVAAVISGGLALLVPSVHLSADVAEWLRACVIALRARYATPAGTVAGVLGAMLAAAVLLRVVVAVAVTVTVTARWRRGHVAALSMLSSSVSVAGACVLADDEPVVYCLPGAHQRIVVTTGALHRLSPAELEAVLSHERAHLRQRHHLVLVWTSALVQAFPRVRMFSCAHRETRRLVELLADDAASRTSDRLDLAGALLNLGQARSPRFALGAVDTAAAQRVRRLIEPPARIRRVQSAALYVCAAVMFALPVLTLIGPALAAGDATFCPIHLAGDSTSISHG
jgi:Zn-dependent protease with chaperone function